MDGLKLIGRHEEGLSNLIQIVKTISNDIKLKFGLEKWVKICLKSGKVHRKQYMANAMDIEMKELDSMKMYTYVGVEENQNIEHKNEKERLKEYIRRLRLILNTELSAKNKMQAVGSLAVPVLG
jgi:hypothetical protein